MIRRWRLATRSVTARFVALVFVFNLPVTAGLLLFVQQASDRALLDEQKDLVSALQDDLQAAFAKGGRQEVVDLIHARLNAARGANTVVLLVDKDNVPIAGNLGAWPPTVPSRTDWRTIDLYRTRSDTPEHMGLATDPLPDGSRVLAGHVMDANIRLARINEEAIFAAFMLGIVLTLVIALFLSRFVSQQLQGIVSTTVAVGEGRLVQRVPVNGSGDAFDALGDAINAMLERIEALVSQLRLMTDGLAHDLKSPITRLKSVLERAIIDTRDPSAVAALEKVADEAETLLTMLSTALLISRTEAGMGRADFIPTEIDTLLVDLAEIYGPLVEDRGFEIAVNATTGLSVPLHRELLSQAIGNLIENALKYAAGGHRIVLSADQDDDFVQIVVSDDGPGIPEDQKADALRRFGRLDPSRHITGSGLGLALVEAVARLHQGALTLEDNGPGLRAIVSIER